MISRSENVPAGPKANKSMNCFSASSLSKEYFPGVNIWLEKAEKIYE